MEKILDAAFLGERQQAHEYLAQMLDLPSYYGRNLDALHDCLSEMREVKLIIKNTQLAGDYFRILLPVLTDSCSEVILEEESPKIEEDYDDSSDGDN